MREVREVKSMNNLTACPRCGNTEVGPEYNYCIICGLQLKENAPAGFAEPDAGANRINQVQDKPIQEVCQMEEKK